MYIVYSTVSDCQNLIGIEPVSPERMFIWTFEVRTVGFVTVSCCVSVHVQESVLVTVVTGFPPDLSL